jgi:hypothetical protein
VSDNTFKERLLTTLDDLEITKNQLASWIESIEELLEIQDAFQYLRRDNAQRKVFS